MANPERGELALTVKDRPYTLVLDFEAYCAAEGQMSADEGRIVPISEIMLGAAGGSWRHVRALIYGALRTHQPTLSVKDAGQFITDAGGPEKLLKTIAKLRGLSEPEEKSARPRKARQPKTRVGARTTSTPDASGSQPASSGG